MQTDAGAHHSIENTTLGKVHYHSYTFKQLQPDTLYAYRVQGERGKWSEWLQTRTASNDGKVSFVYLGDSQNGVRSHWSRVIRQAFQTQPDADFFLHAGDLVSKGDSDLNWAEWFDAGSFIHRMIPSVPVRGNHENITVKNEHGRQRVRTPFWRAQFTLPIDKSLDSSLKESNYQLHYGDSLDVFVVDSATKSFEQQVKWLEKALTKSTATWRVLTMHHPFFVPEQFARNKTDLQRSKAFNALLAKHHVDLVLTGHIHTYLRGVKGEDHVARRATAIKEVPQRVGAVFAISASGAKNTDIDDAVASLQSTANSPFRVSRHGGNTPMYQVININQDTLTYQAFSATGNEYDSFSLKKDNQGNILTNGKSAFGDQRLFSNTGKYIDWYDLR